ncbi:MAG: DUF3793 family protein [Clostridia bacterium]|nr:DUF3793 family protein [Clostridia bacterium]
MSEESIVRHCSPTLAGLKTASMFTYKYKNIDEMRQSIRLFNRLYAPKGLRALPLRYRNDRALIYIYRPARLSRDLGHTTACRLLRERGYDTQTPARCLTHLARRIGESEQFPHEVGLFLGYPPEDVCGFIEQGSRECKCVGCWKVYGDVEAAQKTFARYKKCTDIYCQRHACGRPLERLAVRA